MLEKNSEFLYNLANPLLSPSSDYEKATSGPYELISWEPKHKITLRPNPYFSLGHPQRPNIEFYFVAEDTVALNLYEKNELDFLRRLPTLYIPKFKNRSDFFAIDQFRFDYYGFSPSLKDQPKIRWA